MYYYSAFQLTISSEIEIHEFSQCESWENTNQILIKYGYIDLSNLEHPFYQTTKNCFWLNVPGIARFLVQDGKQITIDPATGSDEDSIRVFLLKSCFGALLMQRNLLVLHGSVIKFENHIIALLGRTVTGKSSIAAKFLTLGASMLTDYLCVINNAGYVIPSYPYMNLWFDTLEHLQLDITKFKKTRSTLEKFSIPLENNFHPTPELLTNIYAISTHNKDIVMLNKICGAQKIRLLKNHNYRSQYAINSINKNFKQYAFLANNAKFSNIVRPQNELKLNKIANLIIHDLTSLDKSLDQSNVA